MPHRQQQETWLSLTLRTLWAPIATLGQFFRDLLGHDERLRHEDSVGGWILGLLTLPWRLLVGCFTFVIFSWSSTRSGTAFLWGLPAFGVLLGGGGALLLADLICTEAQMISVNNGYYQLHSRTAPDHPEWAEMFARKLIEIQPDKPQPKYLLGLSLERAGETGQARDIMSAIAPPDQVGFGPAHLWFANQLISDASDTDGDHLLRAESQLKLAIQAQDQPDVATDLRPYFELGRVYQMRAIQEEEGSEEAIRLLELANQQFQKLQAGDSDLLKIYSLRNLVAVQLKLAEWKPEKYRRESVVTHIDEQIDDLLRLARQRYPNEMFLWETMVVCLVQIGEPRRAIKVIRVGLNSVTVPTRKRKLQKLASQVRLEEASALVDATSPELYTLRLKAICQAVGFDPQNEKAYRMLLDFVGNPVPEGEGADPVDGAEGNALTVRVPIDLRRLLEFTGDYEFIENNKYVVGLMAALVGIQKIAQGDLSGGKKSWRIGEELDARTSDYIYHLLDAATAARPEKFSNLLDMISLAIELFPEQPLFYVTRGVHQKGQGRYEEAIRDFQAAIGQFPDQVVLRQQLKICYAATGQDDLAREQADRIDALLMAQDERLRQQNAAILERIEAIEAEAKKRRNR